MDSQYTHLDQLNGNLAVFSGLSHKCITFYLKTEFCLMEQNGFSFWGKTNPHFISPPQVKWTNLTPNFVLLVQRLCITEDFSAKEFLLLA